MSKISLEPNASGAGTFTLAAPNSNTNRTLTLPDEAGVVLTDTSDIETQVKTATNATGSAPVFACRAWVNFDGTGTVSIRDSGNVSSITDISTGRYTVNFATAMPDVNYCAAMTVQNESGTSTRLSICESITITRTSSDVSVDISNFENTSFDSSIVSVAAFR